MVLEDKTSKPQDVEQFISWANDIIGVEFSKSTELIYNVNSTNIKSTAEGSNFFKNLPNIISFENDKFYSEYQSPLMMSDQEPTFNQKPYNSLLDKLLRYNIIWNRNYPNPPQGGWITPQNMYGVFDDIVRGKIVCKYADGPHILAKILCQKAFDLGIQSRYADRNLDSGYYSVHCYFCIPAEIILNVNPPEQKIENVWIELQITSQLQDILYNITHQFYAKNRIKLSKNKSEWKWQFNSNEFKAGYLGHALHLFEGIIVELRNEAVSENASSKSED